MKYRYLTIPRAPDFVIGGQDEPYLRRWWVIPRNRWFNIYLHHFRRSDDDRALHDHPWAFNCSILLKGRYDEVVPRGPDYWPPTTLRRRRWIPYFRWGKAAHRVVLRNEWRNMDWRPAPVWTLFITGPVVREWGFYCPKGWRHWREFTDARDAGATGRGCE